MSELQAIVNDTINKIKSQLYARTVSVSSELKHSVYNVMPGGTGVSAPGEPPGVRSTNYRESFHPNAQSDGTMFKARLTNDVIYGPYLEYGTRKMAPRPHCERILEDAKPQAIAIYSEPYV